MFQSPLGEVVKETQSFFGHARVNTRVSIPSRGSGKGDQTNRFDCRKDRFSFQSPLGEVVKETGFKSTPSSIPSNVISIPSRGSGKGDKLPLT